MPVHIWEDPEINQVGTLNQAKQNDWPKETSKKHMSLDHPHVSDLNCHRGTTLSPLVCLSIRTIFLSS